MKQSRFTDEQIIGFLKLVYALGGCDREIMSWVAATKVIDAGLVGVLMKQALQKQFGSDVKQRITIE